MHIDQLNRREFVALLGGASGESSEAARVWSKVSVRFATRSVTRMAKEASNCERLHAMRNLL